VIAVTWESLPLVILTILVGVLGVARLTVILVYDDFPPAMALRNAYWRLVGVGGLWSQLFRCWWCMAIWVAAICIGMYVAGMFFVWAAWIWWISWGILALGYVAPMVIVRDGRD